MSTARFERITTFAKGNEGNYANTPGDTGGETYRGISRVWWPKWQGWAIIDAYKKQVNRPLKNNEKVPSAALEVLIKDFYFANFYVPVKAESIKNESVATTIYDHALGVDTNDATKLVQKILANDFGFGSKMPITGTFGLVTLNNLNSVDPKKFFDLYNAAREAHYRKRAATVANQAQFLTSWLSRLKKLDFKDVAVKTGVSVVGLAAFFFTIYLINTNNDEKQKKLAY
ncbi:MAG: glycosyl hydrolase 108 family protein [Bacteroidota bacterium]